MTSAAPGNVSASPALLFLPVTRPWAVGPVVAALAASDVPRRVVLLIDAPGCDVWVPELAMAGFTVTTHRTHNPAPPADVKARRPRHLAMRRLSQQLTCAAGRVLYLEDDTLVPPYVWANLTALLDRGYTAASGLQLARHGRHQCGVWRRTPGGWVPIRPTRGVALADAVGHYCLATTGAAYARANIAPLPDEPVDRAHTRQLAPVAVDAAVVCGHLLRDGRVL